MSCKPEHSVVEIGGAPLTIEQVLAVAELNAPVRLSGAADFVARIDAGATFLDELLSDGDSIYGVTTGYGDSCTVSVPPELVADLPLHLTRYHGCGMGRMLDAAGTLATLVARLNSLAQGYSGVRPVLLERLALYINERVLPCIPSEGSVGASGDLTPLSYVAAALVGERDVTFRGRPCTSRAALEALNLPPLGLAPKEGLALMNGTAVMTGLACLAFGRADYLSRLAARITALASFAMRGNPGHFDPRLFAVKPHAGQIEAASWIWSDLGGDANAGEGPRLQDRYSIRCAPHVVGVLRDALTWIRRDVENELNSANDNPIIDGLGRWLLHGGHFYGGHIAFAMDGLKTAVAGLADLMDRQLALLVDSRYNHGLPHNLSGSTGARAAINHGFKAVQISASAWTAEALKQSLPAAIFSRSTECHNQDKVSLGTIAARDCLRVLELVEQVAAAMILACLQGVRLAQREGNLPPPILAEFCAQFADEFPFIDEDRPLENELCALADAIRRRDWSLYA